MLVKKFNKDSGKVLKATRHLLVSAAEGYVRPKEYGSEWWLTTTSIWPVDELIGRRIRDWRRLLGETGHTGTRTMTMRSSHDSIYTGTHSVFPAPLAEWIILRYGGVPGTTVLDAFAGGPPRAVITSLMGYRYIGYDIRQEQIDENLEAMERIGITGVQYLCADGTSLAATEPVSMDFALTCPPYYDLERYSDLSEDLSNLPSYEEFDAAMLRCAHAHRRVMKPGAFVCIVTSCFRKKNKAGVNELIDFPGDTIVNFKKAGFHVWQKIILSRNFASAAVRSTTSWLGKKLIPRHEELLVFRTPGGESE